MPLLRANARPESRALLEQKLHARMVGRRLFQEGTKASSSNTAGLFPSVTSAKKSGTGNRMALPPLPKLDSSAITREGFRVSRRLPTLATRPVVVAGPFPAEEGSELAKLRELAALKARLNRRKGERVRQGNHARRHGGPGKAGAYRKQKFRGTGFPGYYKSGQLPIALDHGPRGNALNWLTPIVDVNVARFLPIFLNGIREVDPVNKFMACQGVVEMLEMLLATNQGHRVVPGLDQIVHELRLALDTHRDDVVLLALKVVRTLLHTSPQVGPAMTPFYRKLCGPMNLFVRKQRNLGDEPDFAQAKENDVGAAVMETLELMERMGSADAFQWIKYCVPTYESCA